jgi:hypothetical protein
MQLQQISAVQRPSSTSWVTSAQLASGALGRVISTAAELHHRRGTHG